MENVKIQNMKASNGNKAANQFEIFAENGKYFQSYQTVIAFIPYKSNEKIKLDSEAWDYSRTTGKYRNMFLRETKKETEAKIKSGEYELTDLNG